MQERAKKFVNVGRLNMPTSDVLLHVISFPSMFNHKLEVSGILCELYDGRRNHSPRVRSRLDTKTCSRGHAPDLRAVLFRAFTSLSGQIELKLVVATPAPIWVDGAIGEGVSAWRVQTFKC